MIALYAGSFSPPTVGHMDVIARGVTLFDHVIVAIMANAQKTNRYTPEQRADMLRAAIGDLPRVSVVIGRGLTALFARSVGADVLLRGVRGPEDMALELSIAEGNRRINGIETVFLPARPEFSRVSSTIVNEIAAYGGPLEGWAPSAIIDSIRQCMRANCQ